MPQKTKRRPSISRRARIVAVVCLITAVILAVAGLNLSQREARAENAAAAEEYNSKVTAPAIPTAKLQPFS